MKYTIDDILLNETKDIDVTSFFPAAKEKDETLFITVKRLLAKHEYVVSIKTRGNFQSEKEYMDVRKVILLNGVEVNDKFPLARWDEETIDQLEENKSIFLDFLIKEITDFNRPLARRKDQRSSG